MFLDLTAVNSEINSLFNFSAKGVVACLNFTVDGALSLEFIWRDVVGATLVVVAVALVALD